MAGDGKIHMPGGMGGLVRYDEEYNSRFMLSPMQVVWFLIAVAVLVLALKIFWPVVSAVAS
jgi:preprotein translocase subunit Sec61beta